MLSKCRLALPYHMFTFLVVLVMVVLFQKIDTLTESVDRVSEQVISTSARIDTVVDIISPQAVVTEEVDVDHYGDNVSFSSHTLSVISAELTHDVNSDDHIGADGITYSALEPVDVSGKDPPPVRAGIFAAIFSFISMIFRFLFPQNKAEKDDTEEASTDIQTVFGSVLGGLGKVGSQVVNSVIPEDLEVEDDGFNWTAASVLAGTALLLKPDIAGNVVGRAGEAATSVVDAVVDTSIDIWTSLKRIPLPFWILGGYFAYRHFFKKEEKKEVEVITWD